LVGETETRRTVACETSPELLLADELEAEVKYQYPRMNPEITIAHPFPRMNPEIVVAES